MYRVTKKTKTPNVVWDAENSRVLARFTKGVFETDDKAVANKLKALGHTVKTVKAEADTDEAAEATEG